MGVISVNLMAGDRAPSLARSGPGGDVPDEHELLGRPTVLFFYLADGGAACVREIAEFRDLYEEFSASGVAVVGVGMDPAASHRRLAIQHNVPFPLLSDPNGHLSLAYGAAHAEVDGAEANISMGRRTFLIDANGRVAKVYQEIEPATHAAEVLADARRLCRPEEPRCILQQAPVLLIANVLPLDLCRHLTDLWEARGGDEKQAGGVGGQPSHVLREGSLRNRVKGFVEERVVQEVQKAFNYDVTRFEDFRLACNDAVHRGDARARRDNATAGTSHRRFAMCLSLNDEYDGGTLRFPEYGPHVYRPPAGCAVVFSCSLLHEATDVTAGRRFVLLSYFYGEDEARLREEYSRRTGGEYRSSFQSPAALPSTAGDQAHAAT